MFDGEKSQIMSCGNNQKFRVCLVMIYTLCLFSIFILCSFLHDNNRARNITIEGQFSLGMKYRRPVKSTFST